MSSTNFVSGFGESSKPSSKVLRPPGGGSSDIFGNDTPATPRSAKNHMASNIFGSEQNSSVKNNGDNNARRVQKNVDSYSRLFGEPDRPFTPAKNHMKSSIPIGGNGELKKNGNGTNTISSTSTNGTNGAMKNGNGKFENGSVSTTSSSEYQNGVSKTESDNQGNLSQRDTQEAPQQSTANSDKNCTTTDNLYTNSGKDINNNNICDQFNGININSSHDNNNNNNDVVVGAQYSTKPNRNYEKNDLEISSLKTIPEMDTKNTTSTAISQSSTDPIPSTSIPSEYSINNHNDGGKMSDLINNNNDVNIDIERPAAGFSNNNNNTNNSMQYMSNDKFTTDGGSTGSSGGHNNHGNNDTITTGARASSASYRHVNMNNTNHSPRSFNSRNPVTGLGVEASNLKPRKWAAHKDGNPVTGEGYKPAGGEINTTIPCLNGANQVINKNRIPPGGFSSGLW